LVLARDIWSGSPVNETCSRQIRRTPRDVDYVDCFDVPLGAAFVLSERPG